MSEIADNVRVVEGFQNLNLLVKFLLFTRGQVVAGNDLDGY